jgi:hypothetical protein
MSNQEIADHGSQIRQKGVFQVHILREEVGFLLLQT